MKTRHVATYHTQTGQVALKIDETTTNQGKVYYNYFGKYGAGSGHPLEHVKSTVRDMLRFHRKTRLVEGQDILESA